MSIPDAPIDLDRYFARVGYDGPVEPTLPTLERLHALPVDRVAYRASG